MCSKASLSKSSNVTFPTLVSFLSDFCPVFLELFGLSALQVRLKTEWGSGNEISLLIRTVDATETAKI